MDFEGAQLFSDRLNTKLHELGKRSYSKLTPVPSSEGTYEVHIVLHPDEDGLADAYPDFSFRPWVKPSGDQYVEKTPRTPSRRDAPFDDFYPSVTKRRHETSTHYPDVNPNYPGLRRVPDIQDLVRKVAMRPELRDRLVKVDRVVSSMKRLSRFAKFHRGQQESARLVQDLLAEMKAEGHTGRHKCVRLVKKLQAAMKEDGYRFE